MAAGLFELYSARPGADLFRRPSPWRRVDDPAAHHLRIRDRAVRCRSRRLLPAHHRCHPPKWPHRPSRAPCRHGRRAGLDGHAGPGGRGVGVAELEVPAARPRRGHDLRPLDPDPEAGPRRRRSDGDRGLARGRAHGRRSPLRRGRGRRERPEEVSGQGPSPTQYRGARPSGSGLEPGSTPQPAPPPSGGRRWRKEPGGAQSGGRGGSAGRRFTRFGARAPLRRAEASPAPPVPRLSASAKRRRDGERFGGRPTYSGSSSGRRGHPGLGARRGKLGQPAHARDPAPPAALGPDPAQAGASRASRYSITRRVS